MARFLLIIIIMNVAIPVNNNELSAVVDFCSEMVFVGLSDGQVSSKARVDLNKEDFPELMRLLDKYSVELIICGMMSNSLMSMIESKNIEIVSNISGNLDEVIDAYIGNTLHLKKYTLPGRCFGCRKRKHGWRKF